MSAQRLRLPVLLLVAAISSAAPAVVYADEPTADERAQASGHFRRGIELYDEGSPRAAAVEFRRAYELVPSFQVLYNLGICYLEGDDAATALRTFERYLAEGGDGVPESRGQDVRRDIQRLEGLVGVLDLSADREGARFLVDDLPVEENPLRVNPGIVRVRALHGTDQSDVMVLEVAAGQHTSVRISIPEAPEPAGLSMDRRRLDRTVDLRPDRLDLTTPMWISGAVAVAAAATAAVFGVLALDADAEYAEALRANLAGQDDGTGENLRPIEDRLTLLSGFADGFGTTALIAAGTWVVLFVMHEPELEPAPGTDPPPNEARVELRPDGVAIRF